MVRIYIESYGCASARYDSQIMAGLLTKRHQLVRSADVADVIILNTCTVKVPTEKKMISRIAQFQTQYPDKKLVVAGCMPEAQPEIIRRVAPQARLISTGRIADIESVVESKHRIEVLGKPIRPKTCLSRLYVPPISPIEICSGCDHACAYCITKLAKGNMLSYPANQIIENVRQAISTGCREIWLTGQDIAGYSYRDTDLPKLLDKIDFDGDYMIRLGMMNPASVLPILDRLVEAYKNQHIFKFLHIPVQAGSNRILKAMNRKYTVTDFKKIVNTFRAAIPHITVWTDVIVGFPGETDEDFNATQDLIEELRPDFVNISKFGQRPGTPAARLPDLPVKVKNVRSRMLSEMVAKISAERNATWIGWKGWILIDEWSSTKRNWIGRNFAYKPVVVRGRFKPGQYINVEVVSATKTHLKGRLL